MIKAIAFDLDGVLVNAVDHHHTAFNMALQEFGYPPIHRFDFNSKLRGIPSSKKLEAIGVPKNIIPIVEQSKQKYMMDLMMATEFDVPKGKIEMLKAMRDRGIKMACVTNTTRENAEYILKETEQLDYLDLLICKEDVENKKPNPECFTKTMERLSVAANEVLCVEDSEKGLRAATDAGITHVWIVNNSEDVTLQNLEGLIT